MEFAAWLTATGTFLRTAWTVIRSCQTACCPQDGADVGNTASASPTPQAGAAESVPLTSNHEENAAGDDGPTPESGPSGTAVTKQPSPKPLPSTQNDTKKPPEKPLLPTQNDIKPPSSKPLPTKNDIKPPCPKPLPTQNDIKPPYSKPSPPTQHDVKPPPPKPLLPTHQNDFTPTPSAKPLLPTQNDSQTNQTHIPTINAPTTNNPITIPSNTNNPTFNPTIENNPTNTNSQPNTNNPVFTFNPTNTNNPTYTNNPTFTHNPIMAYEPVTTTSTIIGRTMLETQQMIDTSVINGKSQSESELQTTPSVEWVRTNCEKALALRSRAIVGGYDADGSDLWVIRTTIESEIRPAKFSCGNNKAFVASLTEEKEKEINVFEVCCIPSGKKLNITWEKIEHRNVPENAVVGGETSDGKPLYIGRKIVGCSQCPGMIRPDDKCLYLSYENTVHKFETYEVMCTA